MHTRDTSQFLQQHAPAVKRALERALEAPVLDEFIADFERVIERGAASERGIVREAGVSFNPRVGRLLGLLMGEAGLCDLLSLRALLWSTVVPPLELDQVPEGPVRTVVAQVISGAACGTPEAPRVSAIRAVLLLDAVRHLHLSTVAREEKERLLHEGQQQLGRDGAYADALRAKLSYALTSQRRLLQVRDET